VKVIRPGGLPREQLRMPYVKFSKERVSPIRYHRREVGPILPLERKQGRRVVEANQLKVWHGELEARCRFRVRGLPAYGLPPEKGTFVGFWRVSFVSFFHVFLPLLNVEWSIPGCA
jgi:hypothetical protein